jgi:hypothetical protein
MSTVELTEAEVMARIDAEVRQVINSFSGVLPLYWWAINTARYVWITTLGVAPWTV